MSVFHAKLTRLADLLTEQSLASHLGHLATVKSAGVDDREHVVSRERSKLAGRDFYYPSSQPPVTKITMQSSAYWR